LDRSAHEFHRAGNLDRIQIVNGRSGDRPPAKGKVPTFMVRALASTRRAGFFKGIRCV
jgi:hypothetical protein